MCTCGVCASVRVVRKIVSIKTVRYFVPMHVFNAIIIYNCMQLKLRDLLTTHRSAPNEMMI